MIVPLLLVFVSSGAAGVSTMDVVESDLPRAVYSAETEELGRLLAEAVERSPGVRALHAEWLAALERIPQVTALDDPMFTYGQFLQSEINRFRVMLSQRFPWSGTRRLRGEQAQAEADAVLRRLFDARNRVVAEVKSAYYEYAFLAQRIETTRSQAEVLAYVEDIVRSKLALGLAGDDELLRVSMAEAELEDAYQRLHDMRPALSGRLLAAVGRDPGPEFPWPELAATGPDSADTPSPPEASPPPQPVALARARVANPSLQAFDRLAEGRRKQAEVARKAGFPDVTVGLEYMGKSKPREMLPDRIGSGSLMALEGLGGMLSGAAPFNLTRASINAYGLATTFEPMNYSDGGEDDIVLSVSVNLPIWRKKIRAGVAEARLMEKAVVHEKRKASLEIDAAVQEAMFELSDAERRRALYRETLLPQARQTFESLQGRYAVGHGTAGFVDLMESVQRILTYELAGFEADRDRRLAAARLEYLMGGPWTEDAASDPQTADPAEPIAPRDREAAEDETDPSPVARE